MIEDDMEDGPCRHLNDPDDCAECQEHGADHEVDEDTLINDRRLALDELQRMKDDAACDAAYFAALDAQDDY